ncbi:hypothetical protein, partial [Undibacterium sp. RuRC25W]|uniref:hypothetical protein n=1 Tax=Undibacterium sp. RuRC25W TaxID=3413047 RepID=UPI003BF365DB
SNQGFYLPDLATKRCVRLQQRSEIMQQFINPVNSLTAFAVLSGSLCRFRVILTILNCRSSWLLLSSYFPF